MTVIETYAARLRRQAREGAPDVYKYDDLPRMLPHQIGQILTSCLGVTRSPYRMEMNPRWGLLETLLNSESEAFAFTTRARTDTPHSRCLRFLGDCRGVPEVLSRVELACRIAESEAVQVSEQEYEINLSASDGIAEINERFRLAAVGYRYEQGEIIRVDSEYLHGEVVREALRLVSAEGFDIVD